MKKALIIKMNWLQLILDGDKTWEIRGQNTKIRGEIYLAGSKTGKIFGKATLIDCIPITNEKVFSENFNKHKISAEFDQISYKNVYAWVLSDVEKFEKPIPYKHPQGAVIWVNI